jgi:hypothetical protein
MTSSLFEIMELSNGDVVLQRADEEGAPLVSIRFSAESLNFLRDSKFDVARAMIEAGMEAAGDVADQAMDEANIEFASETHQLH